jgi:hypothetical protein
MLDLPPLRFQPGATPSSTTAAGSFSTGCFGKALPEATNTGITNMNALRRPAMLNRITHRLFRTVARLAAAIKLNKTRPPAYA